MAASSRPPPRAEIVVLTTPRDHTSTTSTPVAAADETIRTLVVDDQEPFRDALRNLIGAAPGFKLVGEATCGEDAIGAVEELSPSLVLMDVRMPGLGGIEAARTIAERHPELVVVLISVHGEEELPPELVHGGQPADFVRKQNLRPQVLRELWERHQS